MDLNQILNITSDPQDKECSRCKKTKLLSEFTRLYYSKIQVFDTCNDCSEKRRKKSSISEDNNSKLQKFRTDSTIKIKI
ncbi:17190_t:CDS:1, partial [Gigaspora rosea]